MRTTPEEWSEAWAMFNGGLRRLNELARKDRITITLGRIPTIGRVKKAKKS